MRNDRFEVFTSFLIAFVTILAALTAWRVSTASIQAGDADFDGISAAIRSQEERARNAILTFEHQRAFTSYYRYNEMADRIETDNSPASDREKTELYGVALGLQYSFFPSRYVDREGVYDTQRELDELWAESSSQKDLNPEPHFQRGDLYREKANMLTLSLIIFAFSFFFLSLAQAFNNLLRYLFGALGGAALLAGICLALIFEFSL